MVKGVGTSVALQITRLHRDTRYTVSCHRGSYSLFQVLEISCDTKVFFLNVFIDYAITVVSFPAPLTPLHPAHPLPPTFPPYSSCPWVILISSLVSTFPTLFLPSPCLFSTYHLCYLFSVPFPTAPSHSLIDNPPCDLHLYGSVPVLVVCLVCFCFCFRCGC